MLQSFEMKEDINNFHLSGKLNILDYDTPPSLQPERYAVSEDTKSRRYQYFKIIHATFSSDTSH